jgi:hypothetical protein
MIPNICRILIAIIGALIKVCTPTNILGWFEASICIYIPDIETDIELVQGWYYFRYLFSTHKKTERAN